MFWKGLDMEINKKSFGVISEGQEAHLYRLQNAGGAYIEVTDYGACLVKVVVPDRNGVLTDVVLGYDTVGEYEKGSAHFGAVVGRNCNRIEKARVEIGGKVYQLAANNGENNLHSGPKCFEYRLWEEVKVDPENNSVTFGLSSPDGDQGYPGNFRVQVTYGFSSENEVSIQYTGSSDAETIANMTNHSYFNLNGHDQGRICDHLVTLNAHGFTPVKDSGAIPTGEIRPVEGTVLDFTEEKMIGQDIEADEEQIRFGGGFDHNFVCDHYQKGESRVIARVRGPKRGITMEVRSDLPGVQFYTGNFIREQAGKNGCTYHWRDGLCLETQYFPNSINDEHFESPLLEAGSVYRTMTVYRFGVEKM